MKTLSKSGEYVIASRRIAGTHAQKLAQIDQAIEELQNIKLLECAGDRAGVQFVAVPRRTPWLGMAVAIVVMLVLLVLLLGVLPARAQDAGNPARAPTTEPDKPAVSPGTSWQTASSSAGSSTATGRITGRRPTCST